MKTIKLLFVFFALVSIAGCSPENDIKNPNLPAYKFTEDFVSNTVDGQDINLAGWTNFAETGTVKWKQGIYYSDKYAEFSGYQPVVILREPSNIGWLISPAISMDDYENEKLAFDVAQAYVSSAGNSIELLISTDFDGTNVIGATWESLPFTKPALDFDTNFDFFSSGLVDLSSYEGNIYLAFKVKSSGTNFSLDGTWEIDNIRIVDKK